MSPKLLVSGVCHPAPPWSLRNVEEKIRRSVTRRGLATNSYIRLLSMLSNSWASGCCDANTFDRYPTSSDVWPCMPTLNLIRLPVDRSGDLKLDV
jgi:hypothetical protein